MTGADLKVLCENILEVVGQTAIEVQAMHVDGQVAITANEATRLRLLFIIEAKTAGTLLLDLYKSDENIPNHRKREFPKKVRERLTDPKAQGGAMLGTIKTAESPEICAASMSIRDRALILMHGEEAATLHAEQRLLLVLAHMLNRPDQKVDTVHVWGAKPPCGSCRMVLDAFAYALNSVYDKALLYSRELGQDRGSVPRLRLAEHFPHPIGKFGRFVTLYESRLAALRNPQPAAPVEI